MLDISMEARKDFVSKYINSIQKEQELRENLNNVLRGVDPDNCIFCLTPASTSMLLDEMLLSMIGEYRMDYISWWLYDLSNPEDKKVWLTEEDGSQTEYQLGDVNVFVDWLFECVSD